MAFSLYHFHICTDKPKGTAEWWCEAFRLKVLADWNASWGGRTVACLSENGLQVRFSDLGRGNHEPEPPTAPMPYERLDHIGFGFQDIDATVERLVTLGAERHRAPGGSANVPGHYHFVRVPGNVTLESNPLEDAAPRRFAEEQRG